MFGSSMANDTKSILIPGKGGIDVERLKDNLDLNMDVSQLSLYEIRVLKTALEARQGKCIMESELRGLFDQTSWYREIAVNKNSYEFDEKTQEMNLIGPKISFTPQEQAFLDKLNEAENQLKGNNMLMLGTKS